MENTAESRAVFSDGSVEQCSGKVFTLTNADDRSQSESQSVASEPACAGRLVSDQSVAGKLPRYNCYRCYCYAAERRSTQIFFKYYAHVR